MVQFVHDTVIIVVTCLIPTQLHVVFEYKILLTAHDSNSSGHVDFSTSIRRRKINV